MADTPDAQPATLDRPTPIGVGVIGLGFMGRTHVAAYQKLAAEGACRLVAVCDASADRRTGRAAAGGNIGAANEAVLFDPAEVSAHADPAALLADPGVRLVSICTPTDTHVELALAALAAGKDVLVEKPVALSSSDAARLAAAAAQARGRFCMPAMCMRFWPGWSELSGWIRSGAFGRLRALRFRRLAARPGWSDAFYGDDRRSGGPLVDLHIHDVDLVHHLLGPVAAVSTRGEPRLFETEYRLAQHDARVTAEGGWIDLPAFPFRMQYTAVFDGGVAEYDSLRPAPLVLTDAGGSRTVELPPETGYEVMIRHAVDCSARGRRPGSTPEEAAAALRTVEAEHRSLLSGEPDRIASA